MTGRLSVLHYVTQWLWLSDSFVHGPLRWTRHDTAVVSRGPLVNEHVYPHPAVTVLSDDGGDPPEEGAETAEAVEAALARRPDMVHLHHGYGAVDAVAIAQRLGVPLVTSFWGYDVTALPSERPWLYRELFDEAAALVVPSRFLEHVVLGLGAPADKVVQVPGGIDPRFFTPSPVPAAPSVLFVGRFVEKKGIDVLAQAWPQVRRAVSGAELVLLGYGDLPDATFGDGATVLHPDPHDPRGQVRSLLQWCRVYVSPSRTGRRGDAESQHMGNLEAQASGRPVVTTRHAAIPEFVRDGLTAVVVPEGDPSALAEALIELLSDADRCRGMGAAGVRWAAKFDVRATAAALDDLYDEVVRTARRAQ